MSIDPRQPVIVGVGQFLHRAAGVDDALEPVALMAEAARRAAADAGVSQVPAVDSVRIVSFLSWKYRNPARFLATELGISPKQFAVTTNGGNSPQSLVNATANDIQAGRLDSALLAGGEAFRTFMRARRAGTHLTWPKAPDDDVPDLIGDELKMNHEAETAQRIQAPVQIYPMFESAIRSAARRTPAEHSQHLGQLWSDLSSVAARNPNAWIQRSFTADEIASSGPDNRMIGLPYPKRMNSNNDVDMAAALLMCSAETAAALGVPRDRWVFVASGTDCHEHPYVSHRDDFTRTPAIEIGGRRALELANTSIDDVDLIDLYSCFPSAVQLGAQSLGLTITGDDRRQWSRTGGMAFAGGPWNNYSMHAIATMATELRERTDATGLVWANGGYVTKHSFGVYQTAPPADGFRHDKPQQEIDALPSRELAVGDEAVGRASIEAYTVMFDREQQPEQAIAACRTDDGRRTWATSSDAAITAAMCDGEWVDVSIDIDVGGAIRV